MCVLILAEDGLLRVAAVGAARGDVEALLNRPHTLVYVSSYHICVLIVMLKRCSIALILLYMCSHTVIYVYAHLAIYVSS